MTSTTTRRAVPSSDPIFAAIERHRAADAAFRASDDETGNLDRLSHIEDQALLTLVQTSPATIPGVIALLRYVGEYGLQNGMHLLCNFSDPLRASGAAFLPALADTLEAIAGKAVRS